MIEDKFDKMKKDENDVPYYAPDLGNAEPLKIPDREEEEVDDFETKLDERVIFQRVAKELYKYPTSAVRELLVNAIGHGCKKANEKYGEDNKAYVEVKIHPHDRSLVITDVRGMGMTHMEIQSLMSYVGRSGNADSGTAGQFGMGYFSHLKIADSCIVNTKVREPYSYKGKMITGMSYLNNQGWQWQRINKDGEEVDLEYPGTSISLTMNEDVSIDEVIQTVKEVAEYSDIVVTLELEDDWRRTSAGMVDITQTSDLSTIHPERDDQEVIILDDEDVYFKGVMYKDNWGNMSHDGKKVLTLARVPIDIEGNLIPTFSGYVLNIKNERKYKPLPDRERLSSKSEKALKEKLEALFLEHFGKLRATTAEELERMTYKFPVLFMKQLGIERFFTKATKDFIGNLTDYTVAHISYDAAKVTTEYGAQHNLHQVLAYRKDAIIAYNKALGPIRAIQEWCVKEGKPKRHFIRFDKNTSNIAKSLLEQWKVPQLRDFMKDNKIRAKAGSKHVSGLTIHYRESYSRDTEKITDFDELDYSRTVWVKGPLKPWIKLLTGNSTSLKFTKWHKGAVQNGIDNEETILTDATLYGMQDFNVISSKGKDTFTNWFKKAKPIFAKSSYSYRDNQIYLYNYVEEDLEKPLQMKHVLLAKDEKVSSYSSKPEIKVNNAMIFTDKVLIIHDTDGEEVELDLTKNYDFIRSVFNLIKSDSDVKKAITDQIPDIKIPYEQSKLNPIKPTASSLYGHSPLYKTDVSVNISNQGDISEESTWKVYELGLKSFFGIQNKYNGNYQWNGDMELLYYTKEAIAEQTSNPDIQQMLICAIQKTDYSDYTRGLEIVRRGEDRVKSVAVEKIGTFIKNVMKHIPEDMKYDDKIDLFFKSRHMINNLSKVKDSGDHEYPDFNRNMKSCMSHLITIAKEINQKIKINGVFERFLNEFVKGSASKVTETESLITVACNPSYMFKIKALIELHSNMELYSVKPNAERLTLLFKHYTSVNHSDQLSSYDDYTEITKVCPCGCENNTRVRIIKKAGDYDEDDDY